MMWFFKKNAYGKPETLQVGLGDSNTYESDTSINKYELKYLIGSNWGNYIALAIVPT